MKITTCTMQQYDLQLSAPLTVAAAKITSRQGIILTLGTDTGLAGYGEIAPLPGLHHEILTDAVKQVLADQSDLCGISISHSMLSFDGRLLQLLPTHLFPSVQLGVEMAILDILLQSGPAPCNFPESIPVNALLVPDDRPIPQQVDELLLQGFTSIKIKVARGPLEKDIRGITEVLSRLQGRASLRLDANRGWTLEQAMQFFEAIDPQGIEYIEEPTQNPADHAHLARRGVPIALDETLSEKPLDQLHPQNCRAIVLKPAVLGGFEKTAVLIQWAKEYGILPVLSSTFETGLTTRMYLYFAVLMKMTQIPLGLDTGKYFNHDLLCEPLMIEQARITLPSLDRRPVLNDEFLKAVEGQ